MKTLYSKKWSDFNYFQIQGRLPYISFDDRDIILLDDKPFKKFGFYMPSGIYWFKDEDCFSLGIDVLGFGLHFIRQWGY